MKVLIEEIILWVLLGVAVVFPALWLNGILGAWT